MPPRGLVVISILALAPCSFAQEVISPYDDAPPASTAAPAPPSEPVAPAAPAEPVERTAPVAPTPPVAPASSAAYPGATYPSSYVLTPPEPRYREVLEPRYGLLVAGAVVLGSSWMINASVGYMIDEWRLMVPVVGPFLQTQRIDTSDGAGGRSLVMLLVFDGMVQAAGLAMTLVGALTHHPVRQRIAITPAAGRGMVGLAASGVF